MPADTEMRLPQGLGLRRVDRGAWQEIYLTGTLSMSGTTAPTVVPETVEALAQSPLWGRLRAGHVRLFGPGTSVLADAIRSVAAKGMSVCRFRGSTSGQPLRASIQVFGVEAADGAHLTLHRLGNSTHGWVIHGRSQELAFIANVASARRDPVAAYDRTYRATLAGLRSMGFEPANLTRTWCFFRDVLSHYNVFNDIRRRIFEQHAIGPRSLPASTGIQGLADDGSHLVMDALAMRGTGVDRVIWSNPAQQDAATYGSLFARAIRLRGVGPEQVIISGLAAIDSEGRSQHPTDPVAQLHTTTLALETLLGSCDLSLSDVVSATAYLHPHHADRLKRALQVSPLKTLPLAQTIGQICRPELAFEIEAMAFGSPGRFRH